MRRIVILVYYVMIPGITGCQSCSGQVDPDVETFQQEISVLQAELETTYESLQQFVVVIDHANSSVEEMQMDVLAMVSEHEGDMSSDLTEHVETISSCYEGIARIRQAVIARVEEEVGDLMGVQISLDTARQALRRGDLGETRRVLGGARFEVELTQAYMDTNGRNSQDRAEFLLAAAQGSYRALLDLFTVEQ